MLHINTQPEAVKLAPRDKRELAAFNKKADEVLIKQGYSKENIDKLRVLYEVKVGAKNLDDVLKEKGNDFFKHGEFKNLAAKEGLGIARNAKGQQVLEITINSGTTWNWSKELSYPKPNRVYMVNGQVHYQTDELGRVFDKKSELTYENWQKRGRNGHQQRNAGKLGEKDDHGSHLLAHMLGGPGEKINLVPMNKELNGREWLKMEMELNNALKDNKKINFHVKIEYEGNSKRPKRFEVEYKIDGGKAIEHSWNNTPGGK
ncbi:DNA/RNA non-specific endonuclease [Spirobacillus cienkowskii]|uniref:DNA/RNA non-specific endonuclease n=1 Tax=Spirobacillus cienkowskii TaxID=495820 RepID=UPI0030CDF19F